MAQTVKLYGDLVAYFAWANNLTDLIIYKFT